MCKVLSPPVCTEYKCSYTRIRPLRHYFVFTLHLHNMKFKVSLGYHIHVAHKEKEAAVTKFWLIHKDNHTIIKDFLIFLLLVLFCFLETYVILLIYSSMMESYEALCLLSCQICYTNFSDAFLSTS